VQASLGLLAYVLGTFIHFLFAVFWGVLFASIWPWFRRRDLKPRSWHALPMIAWIVMHAAIMVASDNHELLRSQRRHWRLHVAFLLRCTHGVGRQKMVE
jgi:uncharacterized membrane protein